MVKTIGFIGAGTMGKPMSANLLKAGFAVSVFDIDPVPVRELAALGARAASSPADAAVGADCVITMLPRSQDLEEAALGAKGAIFAMAPGATFIDMGTSSPSLVRRIGEAAARRGVSVLDAPVSGGMKGAQNATLSIMVGGLREVYESCMDVFKALGKPQYIGPLGNGQTVKIINNLVTGANLVTICEAMVLGVKAGLDPNTLLTAINASSGKSYSSTVKIPDFVMKRSFKAGFKVTLQLKDMNLALDLARELGMPNYMGSLAKEMFTAAQAAGLGDLDASAVIQLFEKIAGVEVREKTHGEMSMTK
ncbi:MAG TPA: NAD(P)-dependent oxidoreductase [Firmicutes bacterium]|nr:NAD(P)-dependent oxidoreductase [Bacillota bacterium]